MKDRFKSYGKRLKLWWQKDVKWWEALFFGSVLFTFIMFVYYFIKFTQVN